MSDREFENYLTLLAGLLRLDRKQREAIADELRSHLEDRLDELVARGVSKDEAVRQALAEFGDVAGLAGQFLTISRNRKRRWLMRVMTFSLAATLLLAAGIAIFWPGRNAAPGVAFVTAQAPPADPFGPPAQPQGGDPFAPGAAPPAAPADPFGPGAAAPKTDRRAKAPPDPQSAMKRIEAELNKPTTVELIEMPLRDVLTYLQDNHAIPIVLKTKLCEEAGVAADTPITKSLRGVRLGTALDIMLEDCDLTYYVGEVLFVTTPQDAQTRTEVRIYDCRDILAKSPAAKRLTMPTAGTGATGEPLPAAEASTAPPALAPVEYQVRAERLMTMLRTNVDPATWQGFAAPLTVGNKTVFRPGLGSVSEIDGLIVVTTTAQTHKKVERLLDMLREAAGLEIPKQGKVVR